MIKEHSHMYSMYVKVEPVSVAVCKATYSGAAGSYCNTRSLSQVGWRSTVEVRWIRNPPPAPPCVRDLNAGSSELVVTCGTTTVYSFCHNTANFFPDSYCLSELRYTVKNPSWKFRNIFMKAQTLSSIFLNFSILSYCFLNIHLYTSFGSKLPHTFFTVIVLKLIL
jgi:hypothetical protein